ncbi:MAG: hypothetical protein ACJ71Q_09060 [Terriglobales bacterium]
MCGASSEQKEIGKQQQAFMEQVMQQASTVFGKASTVFSDLMNSFAPTVAAGPNQMGFSAPQLANLNSQAITNMGQASRNASQAVKEANAAVGGGNVALPSGADIGRNLSVANSAAAETSRQLGQINEANWETGRENYQFATKGLQAAPEVFNPATAITATATNSGEAAANTANQIAQQDNSWVSGTLGALGDIAGAAMTGGMSAAFPKPTSGGAGTGSASGTAN